MLAINVKFSLANTLETTKTTTGTASATNQTSANNAITAEQLDSGYLSTTLINNRSFDKVDFLDLKNFPFLLRSIQSYGPYMNGIFTFKSIHLI